MLVTTIRKGYKVVTGNTGYVVIGSRSLRGTYYYILARAFDGKKFSMERKFLIEAQKNGDAKVTA